MEGESLPYVRALRPSLPRNCRRQFLASTFFEGKVFPSRPLRWSLPLLRDSPLSPRRHRYTPPEKNLNARNAQNTQVFVFFRKAENASLPSKQKLEEQAKLATNAHDTQVFVFFCRAENASLHEQAKLATYPSTFAYYKTSIDKSTLMR